MCFPFFKSSYYDTGFVSKKFNITSDMINNALLSCSYNSCSTNHLQSISKLLNTLANANEAAMLLAHVVHETGGLEYLEEIQPGFAYMGDNNKSFHGRGYLMLSWQGNYKRAGKALGVENKLINNPNLVKEEEYAYKTTKWYWCEVVRKGRDVGDYNFEATTRAINGAIEITGDRKDQAKHRYQLYLKIAKSFGVKNIASK